MTIKDILAQLQPVELKINQRLMTPEVRAVLPHVKRAMEALNTIYLRQQDQDLPGLWAKVMAGDDENLKTFFRVFNGPWNSLEAHKSVVSSVPSRKPGCSFYPADLSKDQWEQELSRRSSEEREKLVDNYTVIRGKPGLLRAVPFHEEYAEDLAVVARELRAAAEASKHEGLRSYLAVRAETLLNGDYRKADEAWVRLRETPLEVVIGPYEVYEDNFAGIKAAYEGMLMVVDRERDKQLSAIERELSSFARVFPVPAGSKPSVGGLAPIVVVQQLFGAGEASAGVMASAFNLPNDPWVRGNVGWKQIMISNVMQAKFENCTRKISEKLVEDGGEAAFDPYFFFVLLHEVSHGLGPAFRANGEPVSRCLGSHYTAIEEAKADVGALFLLQEFGGRGAVPGFPPDVLLKSFLAGLFRSMRFGLHEAHGAANIVQFNWYEEKGVIRVSKNGRFTAAADHLRSATDELLNKLCEIEAAASPGEAEVFLKRYGKAHPHIVDAIDRLKHIPIDIRVGWPKI